MIDLRHGDFRDVLTDIGDGSVDLVLTDPPYGEEYLPLWSDLAKFSARVLKPGRPLVTYAPHIYLPQIMRQLGEHLDYVWMMALVQPGRSAVIRKWQVRVGWKPVLVYSNGVFEPPRYPFDDVQISPSPEKDWHPWEQHGQPIIGIMMGLTSSSGVVVDPFMGSGTTALVARDLGRRIIGCELDRDVFMTARRRLGMETP